MQGSALELLLGQALAERNETLATAESCTGGLVGHLLTEIPGSSAYFLGGIVAYSNAAKVKLLNVAALTLEKFGAVSRETAIEMADGVRSNFDADFGIAVTGIAGPMGDPSDKPVGLTWLAISSRTETFTKSHQWQGDRSENKRLSANALMEFLLKTIQSSG
ncbi:MAG: CinA family protein [Chloroflexi bacterium]|nr:CinA family protein [Chloroflexota bacterium]